MCTQCIFSRKGRGKIIRTIFSKCHVNVFFFLPHVERYSGSSIVEKDGDCTIYTDDLEIVSVNNKYNSNCRR